jgi:predicted HicB family RNase H-like nuclease
MTYKGYEATVDFDDTARLFHGEVVNTQRDVITFQGTCVEELIQAFHDSVDDYLEFCRKKDRTPEGPVSIDFTIQVPEELRLRLMLEAKREAKSIDTLLREVFRLRMASGGSSSLG